MKKYLLLTLYFFSFQKICSENFKIIIPPSANSFEVSKRLCDMGILSQPWGFLVASFWKKAQFQPGEFEINKTMSIGELIHLLTQIKNIKITIPEGWTVTEITHYLYEQEALRGAVYNFPAEGMLLPDTYFVSYGESRQKIVERLQNAMSEELNQVWALKSSTKEILKTPQDVLILASIVEKETGVALERSRVAKVFLNRLKIDMKLQSDPTTIYGFTNGKFKLERSLTLTDLKSNTLYNTYVIKGLPPTPIACPGKNALNAVMNPSDTNDLYFVANGEGGHNFSEDFTSHKKNVNEYRKKKK